MSGIFKISGWLASFIGKNVYELTPSAGYITMTGAAVTRDLKFNFSYRIVRIEWKHTDNSSPPVDSNDSLDFEIKRSNAVGVFSYIVDGTVLSSDIAIKLGEGFEYRGSILRLVFDTTNTDRIWPIVTIQKLS